MLIENTTERGKPRLRFGKTGFFLTKFYSMLLFSRHVNAFRLFVNDHETCLIIRLHLGENSNSQEDPTVPA